MLKIALMHPDLLAVLSLAGQGSQVLISDGNYPYNTHSNPRATRVFLNLTAGVLSVTQVLEVLTKVIPIDTAQVIAPTTTSSGAFEEPAIWSDFRHLLPGVQLKKTDRKAFQDAATHRDVALVIATGEQRPHGSILLTIGVLETVPALIDPIVEPISVVEPIADPTIESKVEATPEPKVEPTVEIEEKAPRAKKAAKSEPVVAPEPEVTPEPVIVAEPVDVVAEPVDVVAEPTEVAAPEEVAPEEPSSVAIEEPIAETLLVDEDLSDPFADDVPIETKAEVVEPIKEVEVTEPEKEAKKPEEPPAFGSLFE
jgi:L-fucose mutarotase